MDSEKEPLLASPSTPVMGTGVLNDDFDYNDLPLAGIQAKTASGTCLSWSDIVFSVKKRGKKGNIDILRKCSGAVNPGQLCAILGPSGCGKTSLLNVLAGRIGNGGSNIVSGTIKVNESPVNPIDYRENIAYVMQEDSLHATTTVREALEFSCTLRLGSSVTAEQRRGIVDRTIHTLGLTSCQHRLIGNDLIRGVSGGEKKRTAIGIELVAGPGVLFLDEPTSGLDSYAAYNVIAILSALAKRSNIPIIMTVHQPSSELFAQFDSVIMLAKGRCWYRGSAAHLADYCNSLGCPCPPAYNPADHALFVIQKVSADALEKQCDQCPETERPCVVHGASGYSSNLSHHAGPHIQFYCLCRRELLNTFRDKGTLIARFFITSFMSVLIALIFKGVASHTGCFEEPDGTVICSPVAVTAALSARFGAVVQLCIMSMFGNAQPIILTFPLERAVFLRESIAGMYWTTLYFASKMLVEIPTMLCVNALVLLINYWAMELNSNWITLFIPMFLVGLQASSVALLLGCVAANTRKALEASPLLFVPQMLFSGIFLPITFIPSWLRWSQYLCGLKYAVDLAVFGEFCTTCIPDGVPDTEEYRTLYRTLTYGDGNGTSAADLYGRMSIPYDDSYQGRVHLYLIYVGILLGMCVVLRGLAVFFLSRRSKSVY